MTPTDVRTWRSGLHSAGTGAPTVAAATRLLKSVFNRAVDDELIPRSPARKVENPNVDPDGGQRVLEAAEVARLASHPERFRTLVYLLSYRGLRIGEAAAARRRSRPDAWATDDRRDAFGVAGNLSVGPTKTGRVRVVSLPAFLRDMLAQHVAAYGNALDPTAFVSTAAEGGPLRPNNYRKRVFASAVREAGPDPELTPHDLRDTAATLAFSAGASVKEVSLMLGHASPAITLERYTGVLESMRAKTDDGLDAAFRRAETDTIPVADVLAVAGVSPAS